MSKVLIFVLTTIFSLNLHAACHMYNAKRTKVSWTAYKTPAKAGVGGFFRKFEITPKKSSGSIVEVLTGSTFTIDPTSTFTKDASRDKKIVNSFFMGAKISGKVLSVKKNMIHTEITMNGQTKKVPLKFTVKGNELMANGHIDVLDFMMSKNLQSINKACFEKHEGKTWSDVKITLQSTFKGC